MLFVLCLSSSLAILLLASYRLQNIVISITAVDEGGTITEIVIYYHKVVTL